MGEGKKGPNIITGETQKEPPRRTFLKTAGVLAASALLPQSNPPEVDLFPRSYKLVVEPGVHAFHPDQRDAAHHRFSQGDLNAHLWAAQVAQRVRRYRPAMVALDSFSPWDLDAERNWLWLPGSPQQMTGRDSVLLLYGDPLIATSLSGVHQPDTFEHEVRKAELKELYKLIQFSLMEGLANTGLGAGLVGAGLYQHHKQAVAEAKNPTAHNRLSRRGFIKEGMLAAGGGLLLLTAGRAAPFIQSYLDTDQFNDLLATITELTRPVVARSEAWLDGRTAFIIAKTRDAMKNSDLPQGSAASVIVGTPHAYEANPLLRDKKYRAEAMRKYALWLIEVAAAAAEKFPTQVPETPEQLRASGLAFLCQAGIRRVNEPVKKPGQTTLKTVEQAFGEYMPFVSNEAVEALKPLGNFDPYK